MNKIKLLSILLVLQIVLIAWLGINDSGLRVAKVSEPLLNLDFEQIDILEIASKDDQQLKLQKLNSVWVLPDENNFPVAKEKIKSLVDRLKNLNKGWAVGTTLAATKQFKTSDQDFEKQVNVFKGEKMLTSIYFGASPAFKKVYARLASQNETFAVEFSNSVLGTKAQSWADTSLLKVDSSKIKKILFRDLVVEKVDSSFAILDLKDGEEVKTEELDSFVKKLSEITYKEIPSKTKPAGYDAANSVVDFVIQTEDRELSYSLKGPVDGKKYYLLASNQPYYFVIENAVAESIDSFGRGSLVVEKALEDKESK